MKNAKELMLEYTAFSFRDPKKAAEMFAEDGAETRSQAFSNPCSTSIPVSNSRIPRC